MERNLIPSEAIEIICKTFSVTSSQIENVEILKAGMTNKSFSFVLNRKKYIMRIPGEGTEKLINRFQEADVYKVVNGKAICDQVDYINPKNGYKISEFFEKSRTCSISDDSDLMKAMAKLRDFHKMKLKVNHEFDVFRMIDFYENLWNGRESFYEDYQDVKENVFSLIPFINRFCSEKQLCHIDAIPDNFLFVKCEDGSEDIRLIDWEYAGMNDPHLDIAMFCIYSIYNKDECDHLIDIYFEGQCSVENRIKIYCYIAASGLLWSNWCEYKRILGIEFGEYAIAQYNFAKDFYYIAIDAMEENGFINLIKS